MRSMKRLNNRGVLLLLFTVITALLLSSQNNNADTINTPIKHDLWDGILKKYVSVNGNVNYKGLSENITDLNKYLALIKSNHPIPSWSSDDKLAYWINAYNAFTIELIIKNYPLNSIKDIKQDNLSAWDMKFIKIGKKVYSLNEIEHNIIRKDFNEPRIHFGVNCASYSCPRLLNRAFTSDNVKVQLEILTKEFINDTKHNKITNKKVELSQIFNWFKEDFTKDGTLIDYLNKYSNIKISPDAEVKFIEYNWSLNK